MLMQMLMPAKADFNVKVYYYKESIQWRTLWYINLFALEILCFCCERHKYFFFKSEKGIEGEIENKMTFFSSYTNMYTALPI